MHGSYLRAHYNLRDNNTIEQRNDAQFSDRGQRIFTTENPQFHNHTQHAPLIWSLQRMLQKFKHTDTVLSTNLKHNFSS